MEGRVRMTPLQKYLKSRREAGVKIDLDTFGLIMDDFIRENDVQLIVTLPAGQDAPEIRDNIGAGPVMTFYLLLNCLGPVFHDLLTVLGDRAMDKEKLADTLLELVKADMLSDNS